MSQFFKINIKDDPGLTNFMARSTLSLRLSNGKSRKGASFDCFLAHLSTKYSWWAIVISLCPSSVIHALSTFCFKQLLLQKGQTDFEIILQEGSLGNPLPNLLKPFCSVEQDGRQSYSILFYPITLEGRRGTTDEFATIPFHLDLFSAALVELAKSIPCPLFDIVFFCLPLF